MSVRAVIRRLWNRPPMDCWSRTLTSSDGLGRDVDADPLSSHVLSSHAGGGAAAEWIQNHVAFFGGCSDNAVQQNQGLLGGVADPLTCLRSLLARYVSPRIL